MQTELRHGSIRPKFLSRERAGRRRAVLHGFRVVFTAVARALWQRFMGILSACQRQTDFFRR